MQRFQPGLTFSTSQFRQDGVWNAVTGLGTALDKVEHLTNRREPEFSRASRDSLYADNEIFSLIIDKIVDDSIRNWIEIEHPKSGLIMDRLDQLLAKKRMTFAAKMERLDDASFIYMKIDDGQTPDMPLDYNAIKEGSVQSLTVWQRWWVTPDNMSYIDEPEYWRISGKENMRVHKSRLLFYEGDSVSQQDRIQNNGCGSSVARKVRRAVLGYCTGGQNTARLIQELAIDVYSVANLNQMSRNSGKHAEQDIAEFRQKMQFMNMAKDMVGCVLVDASEKYEKRTLNLSGAEPLFLQLSERVATASRYPYGKIFSQYKGNALSSSADAQDNDYNENMCSYQSDRLLDNVKKLVNIVKLEMGIPFNEPVEVCFKPPTAENPTAKAERDYKHAQTDKIYFDMGMPAYKILAARFGESEALESMVLTESDIKMIQAKEDQMKKYSFGLDINPFSGGQ